MVFIYEQKLLYMFGKMLITDKNYKNKQILAPENFIFLVPTGQVCQQFVKLTSEHAVNEFRRNT